MKNKIKPKLILYIVFILNIIIVFVSLIFSGTAKKILMTIAKDSAIMQVRQAVGYTSFTLPFTPDYLVASAMPYTIISEKNLMFLDFNGIFIDDFLLDDYQNNPPQKGEKAPIKEITIKPESDNGYLKYEDVYMIDQSTKNPNIEEIMKKSIDVKFKNAQQGPQIFLYHTHNSEAYNDNESSTYTVGESKRSADNTKNIIAVGDSLELELENNGITVAHTVTKNETEIFSQSYSKSLITAKNYLEKYKTVAMTIDIHRDSLVNNSLEMYRPVVNIDGKKAAQIMIIVGTGTKELPNPHWQDNLRTAIVIQKKLIEKYGNICRPILIRDSRYNMHLTTASLLIEVGTEANSVEEAKYSTKLLATALGEFIKEREN